MLGRSAHKFYGHCSRCSMRDPQRRNLRNARAVEKRQFERAVRKGEA
jgi:hypothetical protein